MMVQGGTYADLSLMDRADYELRLRLRNKILCSYSRYEAFVAAQTDVAAAANYTIVADKCVSHNSVYIFDEDGIMTTYLIKEDEGVIYGW